MRYIQLHDGADTAEIMRRPDAFVLLAIIALRARKRGSLVMDDIQPGQALIGDYRTIGLTERRYRTAKSTLESVGLATFKATNKGTIATLGPPTVFAVVGVHGDEQTGVKATDKRRASDEQKTTNKKEEDRRKKKDKEEASPFSVFASLLEDEQFRRLDTPEIRGIYGEWCGHRREIKKPLTTGAVRMDGQHMLAILDRGGDAGEIVQRIQKAIGAGWRGWYFEDAKPGPASTLSTKRTLPGADPMQSIHQSFTGVS